MEARDLASVGLSLLLAANCFMPCYTLAYADESQEVADVPQEEQEEVPDPSGRSELPSGDGESSADAADGGAAAEGHGPDDGAAEGAIEDIASGHGEVNSFASGDVSSPSDDSGGISSDTGGIEESSQLGISGSDGTSSGIEEDSASSGRKDALGYLEDIVYLLGEIADYCRQGGGGISPLANIDNVYDQLVTFRTSVGGMLGMTEGHSSASNRANWTFGNIKFSTGKTGIAYILSLMLFKVDAIYGNTTTISSNVALSKSTINSMLSLMQDQWGYGYGGTVVLKNNSPAMWLKRISEASYANNVSGKEISVAGYLSAMSPYFGTYSNQLSNLSTISSALYALNLSSKSVSAAGYLSAMSPYLPTISGQLTANGNLVSKGVSDLLATLKANNVDGKPISVAGYLSAMSPYLPTISGQLTANGNLVSKGVSDLLATLKANNVDGKPISVAGYLSAMSPYLPTISGQLTANGNLVSKGLSDVLAKLDALQIEVDAPSAELDLSGIESRLDSIVRLLAAAGVVENAKDVLDVIFGDMGLDATEAASAAVGSAIQNAFPFCVPAVLKQMLGLLQADPSPPEFHFDFWGAPLDFGFSDWQGLADMTSWLSRIGFAVMLFANTRRFVYSGGVAGD